MKEEKHCSHCDGSEFVCDNYNGKCIDKAFSCDWHDQCGEYKPVFCECVHNTINGWENKKLPAEDPGAEDK